MKGNFKLISLVVFIALGVFGVLVFSGTIKIGNSDAKVVKGKAVLWGTVSKDIMSPLIEDFNFSNPTVEVSYVEKSAETFDQELLEAIATDVGPDVFLMPESLALDYKNKIYVIPYESYGISTFKSTYASAGDVFLISEGILAFPLTIDPLMMYYNRSMLDADGVVYPPKDWDEFANLVPALNKKDATGKIVKSATALGQYSNINNAKEIIATLFMQAGNPIVSEKNGRFFSGLAQDYGNITLGSVLDFYTNFANPLRDSYSWNKLFPSSREFFASNNLAFYFGFASERNTLINTNPNLNFGVAPVPQIKNANFKLTGARVTGIAISNFSSDLNSAVAAASLLSAGDFAGEFAKKFGVAPARRDLLVEKPTDEFNPTLYSSALVARSWLDPSYDDTNTIFRSMVEKVLSNVASAENSVKDASSRLGLLLAI